MHFIPWDPGPLCQQEQQHKLGHHAVSYRGGGSSSYLVSVSSDDLK